MIDIGDAVRLLHIALATAAMGTNLSFPVWIHMAEREPDHLVFVLERIRWLDRHVVVPAYGLGAAAGLALVALRGIPLTTGWLAAAILIYVATAILGFAVYAPVARARLAALRSGGPADPAYLRARRQARGLDAAVIVAVLAILALMVTKPF